MNKTPRGKFTTEKLTHFSCPSCKKWWTVGDAPKKKKEWHCPWCGTKSLFKESTHHSNK